MSIEKTFDCLFVTVDDKNRRTVRFANDLTKRLIVFKRANFQVLFSLQSDKQMTKLELLELARDDDNLDVNDEELIDRALLKIKNKNVSAQDVLDTIRERHKQQQQDNLTV